MTRQLVIAGALGLLLGACASGPPPAPPEPVAPPPVNLAGTYDITVSAQGMDISGVMVMEGSASAGYTGMVNTDMGGASLSRIVVDSQTVSFSVPEVGADVEVMFEGDEFTGWLAGGMGDASIIGVRRPDR